MPPGALATMMDRPAIPTRRGSMHNLYYEMAQSQIADLHRNAAQQRLATEADMDGTRRRPLRSMLASITARRRGASAPPAPASEPVPAGRPY